MLKLLFDPYSTRSTHTVDNLPEAFAEEQGGEDAAEERVEPGDDQGVGCGQQRESPRVAEHGG